MVTSGEGQLIINLKAQRLKVIDFCKVAALARLRCVHGAAHFCFVQKWSSHPSVLGRKYVLETYFLFENQWIGDIFYSKTEGTMHCIFCYYQHVHNLISAQK